MKFFACLTAFTGLLTWGLHYFVEHARNDWMYASANLAKYPSDSRWIRDANDAWLNLHTLSIVTWVVAVVAIACAAFWVFAIVLFVYDECSDALYDRRARKARKA